MAVELRLPKLSDEMMEGTVSRWLKQPGEEVKKGEPVVEIETEKVIVEVEAQSDGVLLEILAREQEVVPVEGLLCLIGAAGEAGPADRPGQPRARAKAAPVEAAPDFATLEERAEQPRAARPARAAGSNVVPLVQPVAAEGAAGGPPATPLARRIAAELGIDLARIQGSGIGGKIVKTDLQPHLTAAATRPMAGLPAAEEPWPLPSSSRGEAEAGFVELPHTPLRRTLARRMAESKQRIPHFYMTAEVDMTEALALRQRLNDASERRITVNDLMIKAAALALGKVPEVNAAFTEQAVRRFTEAHIGFAVAIDGGLVTPVVRDCHVKSLGRIAADAAELIERAKARKLQPRELEGGTFTLSNMGMFDVVEFAAIINPPQVAILAVARPQEKPVVVEGRVVVRSRLQATLSADHRALDGVTAAAFLREFKAVVEEPMRLML
jgi:pyruvate dehydrogenase E2 component (dihydrolipoamide acetyltransferase)